MFILSYSLIFATFLLSFKKGKYSEGRTEIEKYIQLPTYRKEIKTSGF